MAESGPRWREIRWSRAIVPPHVVHRGFAQETVLLNIRTGQYYGVDPIGARFLEVLGDSADLERATEALAQEFGQPVERIRADLAEFVAGLERRGLLELEPRDR